MNTILKCKDTKKMKNEKGKNENFIVLLGY